jgi:hypothetical protein
MTARRKCDAVGAANLLPPSASRHAMITASTEARELDDVRSWHFVDITIAPSPGALN